MLVMLDIFLADTYDYAHFLQPLGYSFVISIHIPHQSVDTLFILLALVFQQVELELASEKLLLVIVLILRVNSECSDAIDEVMGMIVNLSY